MIKTLIILSIASLACFAEVGGSPLTVCRLMIDASKHNNKLVKVRGVLRSNNNSSPIFDELISEDCRESGSGPVVIRIMSPDIPFLENPPLGYAFDTKSIQRTEDWINKRPELEKPNKRILATVEGIFYVSTADSDSGRPSRHGKYPAYIVVQAIRNPKAL
jgi:hypothetical protein